MASKFNEKDPLGSLKKGAVQLDVLIDAGLRTSGKKTSGVSDGGRLYVGRTYFQAPQIDAVTYVQSREKLAPGEVVRCVVVGSDGYDLVAKPVSELEKKVGSASSARPACPNLYLKPGCRGGIARTVDILPARKHFRGRSRGRAERRSAPPRPSLRMVPVTGSPA